VFREVRRGRSIETSSAPAASTRVSATETDGVRPDRVDETLRKIFAMVASATGSQSGLAASSRSPKASSRLGSRFSSKVSKAVP
jgi:hypothetical protein